ncbi:MAG: flagellar assembly protein FliH [Gammaproteobacteria bacterium]|jgi:flagellar assembly protein FliH
MIARNTADNFSADVKRFELPLMEGRVVTDFGSVSNANLPTAQSLEALHKDAYNEGFELGRRAGIEKGAEEVAEKRALLEQLMAALATPFKELDAAVVNSVSELAILVAKHLVRRELKVDPGEIVAIVRETMAELPVAARNPRIRMHPEDIDTIEDALSMRDTSRSWQLVPDPLMTRGGCVVESDASRIDATVEARLAAIASKMFGGNRGSDNVG